MAKTVHLLSNSSQGGTEAQRITGMEMNDISGHIIDRALHIHRALGPGLLESVYHRILSYELRKVGLQVDTEVPIPVSWDGHVIDNSFRADLIVNELVLVELKSTRGPRRCIASKPSPISN